MPSDRAPRTGDTDRAGLMNSRQRPERLPSLTTSLESVRRGGRGHRPEPLRRRDQNLGHDV